MRSREFALQQDCRTKNFLTEFIYKCGICLVSQSAKWNANIIVSKKIIHAVFRSLLRAFIPDSTERLLHLHLA